jgi:hypothetical protein
VNKAIFKDWLLCVGPAIQAEHLNGLEFGLNLFFKKKVESESQTLLYRYRKLTEKDN